MAAVRISGVLLPANKKISYALPYLYGIGLTLSRKILEATKIDGEKRTKELTESEANKLREYIEKQYRVEGDLRRDVYANIKHHKEMGTYRGMRHSRRLPARGQRTKTNSRTVRGNVRKTMMSGKRALTKT
ncbi:30S ribosomal protein S13 [Candidatus Uhrbacteria bacterium]|nr:30S ribosomal protein S13 [Candidatus Uhrbacteria bacterium]